MIKSIRKTKVIGCALALMLCVAPGAGALIPFAPSSDSVTVSAAYRSGVYKVITKNTGLRMSPGGSISIRIPTGAYVNSTGENSGAWIKVSYMTSGKVHTGWVSINQLTWYCG